MPAEFVVQDPTAANPPTLFLPLADMARRLSQGTKSGPGEGDEEAVFLKAGQACALSNLHLSFLTTKQQERAAHADAIGMMAPFSSPLELARHPVHLTTTRVGKMTLFTAMTS